MTWMGLVVAGCILLSGVVGYRKGFIREVFSLMFLALTMIIVWTINPYVSDFLKENTPVYTTIQKNCQKTIEEQLTTDREEGEGEIDIINSLPLPESLKRNMEANNTEEVYQYLAVDTFADYLADYLAVMITNGIGFMISYLLVSIGLRMVVNALDIVSRLPIIGGVNRIAGGALGLLKGVVIVWIGFLVVTIFCRTDAGIACMKAIEADTFLSALYDRDIFVQVFLSIFYGTK